MFDSLFIVYRGSVIIYLHLTLHFLRPQPLLRKYDFRSQQAVKSEKKNQFQKTIRC